MLPFPDYQDHIFAKPFAEQLQQAYHPNVVQADGSYSCFASPLPILCPDDLLLFPSPSSLDAFVSSSTTAVPLMLPAAAAEVTTTTTQASEEKSSSCVGRRLRRKDRHSKIVTARGPRDRRMRLSIEVAGKFFQLQDMLGFDKASKTVQWLLTMSATAIRDLAAAVATSVVQSPYSTESSTLVCEDYQSSAGAHGPNSKPSAAAAATINDEALTDREASRSKKKHKTETTCRKKTEFHSATARQSRAKARERAKERAMEKQRFMSSFSDAMKVKEEETKSAQAIERSYHLITTTAAGGPVAMPLYGNTQLELGGSEAIILKAASAGAVVFQQPTWDMEAISYSR